MIPDSNALSDEQKLAMLRSYAEMLEARIRGSGISVQPQQQSVIESKLFGSCVAWCVLEEFRCRGMCLARHKFFAGCHFRDRTLSAITLVMVRLARAGGGIGDGSMNSELLRAGLKVYIRQICTRQRFKPAAGCRRRLSAVNVASYISVCVDGKSQTNYR